MSSEFRKNQTNECADLSSGDWRDILEWWRKRAFYLQGALEKKDKEIHRLRNQLVLTTCVSIVMLVAITVGAVWFFT